MKEEMENMEDIRKEMKLKTTKIETNTKGKVTRKKRSEKRGSENERKTIRKK
jgi:hypothetical protein